MNTTLMKVLLIEDNLADAVLLREILLSVGGESFEVSRVDRLEGAFHLLEQGDFEVVLLDLTLPDSQGLATLERVQSATRNIPIIVITGMEDENLAVQAIRQGAQDYLVKGSFSGRTIAKAIRFAIDRKKTEEKLRQSEAAYMAAKASVDTINAMGTGVVLGGVDGKVVSVNPAFERLTGCLVGEMAGRTWADVVCGLVVPRDLSAAESALADAREGKPVGFLNMAIQAKSGKEISVIAGLSFIRDTTNRPAEMVMTLVDVSEQKKVERQNQIVTTLLALFAKKTSRKDYLDAVTRVVQQWSECQCVGIRVLNDAGDVPYESYVGFSDEFVQSESILRIGRDSCVCTRIITSRPESQDMACITNMGSFRCDNTVKFLNTLSEQGKEQYRGVCSKAGFASVAVIPVRRHERVVGAIHFADAREQMVTVEMIKFVESALSPIIGEALHRFGIERELRALASRLALAEERARRQLAIALHDSVGQSLALAKIKLGSLGQRVTEKESRKELAEIRTMFEEAVQQTRSLSFELSPPILYELGLSSALEWLGEDVGKRHNIQVQCSGNGQEKSIAEPVSILFFQSARELLANVVKHAEATTVHISLETGNGKVVLRIKDNGKGMAQGSWAEAPGRKNSLGLFSIRERMRHIDGVLEIQSKKGSGTTVVLAAPIGEGPADSATTHKNNGAGA